MWKKCGAIEGAEDAVTQIESSGWKAPLCPIIDVVITILDMDFRSDVLHSVGSENVVFGSRLVAE